MVIEPTKNFEAIVCNIWKPRVEPDDLEAVVHACYEQVVPAVLRRMPFYTPDPAPNVSLLELSNGITFVKEADFFVITVRINKRVSLKRGLDLTSLQL